jgi:chemotaxis signal transduction protein
VRDVLVGVHKLPGKLLMIVDADRIVRSVGAAESAR